MNVEFTDILPYRLRNKNEVFVTILNFIEESHIIQRHDHHKQQRTFG